MNGTAGNPEGAIEAYATVRLELESRPESVAMARSTLAALGEYLALDQELLDDLKTAVSEACNNVVLHAYDGDSGPLWLSLEIKPGVLDVRVRDRGRGIHGVSTAENRMGVGLAVISALASRAEFESSPGEGTEVRMWFANRRGKAWLAVNRSDAPARPREDAGARHSSRVMLEGDIVSQVSPVELLPLVMGRLVRAVAAGAHFTVDRLIALNQLTNAIGARAAEDQDVFEVGFAIVGRSHRVELRVAPLPRASGARLFGGGPTPPSVQAVMQEIHATPVDGGELLTVVLVESPR